ncbi:MAG: hypothetical protein ABIO70_03660 [Pseudomonadota bacterium]
MPLLPLLLLALAAHAYDVGDWSPADLKAQVARVVSQEAEVVEARGVPLAHAGAITGAIVGRFELGEYTYCHVQTVYEKDGQSWVTAGMEIGGCEAAAVLGVLDLADEGSLAFRDSWAQANPQEPVATPKKPALAVLSRFRFDDGHVRTNLLLLDLADRDRPTQVLREDVSARYPLQDPRAGRPAQRSLGHEALSLAVAQTAQGPELLLTVKDVATPDSGCLEPAPEILRFLFQEGRFVQQRFTPPDPGCP